MKVNSSKLSITGWIQGGQISYNKDSLKNLKDFLQDHDSNDVDISLIIPDGVRYWQHKYYRGYVLPFIAEGQGEKDLEYLHEFILKQQFLFFPVTDFREIPGRHAKGVRIIMQGNDVIGYVPSMAVLNFFEGKEFILKCEEIRDGLIDWSIHESNEEFIKDYFFTRAKAFNENIKEARETA